MKTSNLFLVLFLTTSMLFSQKTKDKKSTALANVSILKKEFVIPNLNSISHKIWVYLPPDYKTSSKNYPVIYMHDAQNLFDAKTSYVGEWEVDETLNELFSKTNKGFIVVGVEHGGEERINEYTPWEHEKYGGGKGAVYVDFIVNTLKPYIDSNYKTKPQQKYTGLMGSSLGGLISYYGALKYPDNFGKIGALSSSFWFSDEVIGFTEEHGNLKNTKLFLLVGGKEGDEMTVGTENISKLLLDAGFKKKNLKTKIPLEGTHSERFWKAEFLEVIKWLYNIK